MAFSVMGRGGEMFHTPDVATIDRVLAELDEPTDEEHPDVALTHESGWCLSAFRSGGLTWENVEGIEEARHLDAVSRAEVKRLWLALAAGDLSEVESQPWLPGYR